MKKLTMAAVAAMGFAAFAAEVEDVTAYGAKGDGKTDDTAAIMAAQDASYKSGKTLYFPKTAGGSVYLTRKGVILGSGMTVSAEPGAVLANASAVLDGKGKTISTKLTKPMKKGDTSCEVVSTEGLVVGTEVTIGDGGSYRETLADITAIEGNTVKFSVARYRSSGQNEGALMDTPKGAYFLTDIALVKTIYQRPAVNCTVENITLRPYGNIDDPYIYTISPFHQTAQGRPAPQSILRLRNVVVDGSMHDGLSTQGAGDIWIENCVVRNVKHKGIHWGTSCDRVIIRGNLCENCGSTEFEKVSNNGGSGAMYFCVNNHRVLITDNIVRNCYKGVFGFDFRGWGEWDTDSVVAGNLFENCTLGGLWLWDGFRINVTDNVFTKFSGASAPIALNGARVKRQTYKNGLETAVVACNRIGDFADDWSLTNGAIRLDWSRDVVCGENLITPNPKAPGRADVQSAMTTDVDVFDNDLNASWDAAAAKFSYRPRPTSLVERNAKTIVFNQGVHTITEPIKVADGVRLVGVGDVTLEGEGTLIEATGTNFTIERIVLKSKKGPAVVVKNAKGAAIRDLVVEGGEGRGLELTDSRDMLVEDCIFRDSRDAGVVLARTRDVRMVGTLVSKCGKLRVKDVNREATAGIMLAGGNTGLTITSCQITDSANGILGGADDDGMKLVRSSVQGCMCAGLALAGGRNFTIRGNVFRCFNLKSVPIRAALADSTIAFNTFGEFGCPYIAEDGVIALAGSRNVTVHGNAIQKNFGGFGNFNVEAKGATDVKASHNVVSRPVRIKRGNEHLALRDPAVFFDGRKFRLLYTSVAADRKTKMIYSSIVEETTSDFFRWGGGKSITPLDQTKNFCSPGNVISVSNGFILCCCSYPRPDYKEGDKIRWGDETARCYLMRAKDSRSPWSEPEMMMLKGPDVPVEKMGRMIDPYLVADPKTPGKWWCFFKQGGVSRSWTTDFKTWHYEGKVKGGENVCIIRKDDGKFLMFHSPADGIGLKESEDLVTWKDVGMAEIAGREGWEWAKGRLTAAAVIDARKIKDIGKYIMFFHGSGPKTESEGDFDHNASIGMLTSDDLVHWAP